MGILNDTFAALRVEYKAAANQARKDEIATIGERVYELIGEADAFMAGVRAHAESAGHERA